MSPSKKMAKKNLLSPEMEPSYFQLQAYWGATKHAGALMSTRELIELCHINKATQVLDVGCGSGTTPCHIAKTYGCRVVGIDIPLQMINWLKERAKRESVENRVDFIVADAQALPFKPNLFDAVIGESITAFLKDKKKGTTEYTRVTKPQGYVGLNEMIWTK